MITSPEGRAWLSDIRIGANRPLALTVYRCVGRPQEMTSAAAAPVDSASAFAEWIRPHWGSMTRFAQRLVGDEAAEDVVQDALAAAWRSRASFDAGLGAARSWLLAIVANQANDHLRRRGGPIVQGPPPVVAGSADPAVIDAIDLGRAIEHLSERQRIVVALFYYCGLTTIECGEVMGCSTGTVKSTLSDARAALRAVLGEDYQ